MLQQTTVTAVIPYYNRFIERFPDVKTLSDASIEEVYKYWEGLGYYRRALHLHKSAQMIENHFPKDYEDILSLVGVGPYTASAIMSFAYHKPYIAVDGNALRVLSRLYAIEDNIASNKTVKKITEIGNKLVVGYDSAQINQGIMDFSTLILSYPFDNSQSFKMVMVSPSLASPNASLRDAYSLSLFMFFATLFSSSASAMVGSSRTASSRARVRAISFFMGRTPFFLREAGGLLHLYGTIYTARGARGAVENFIA